jgi:hypothetical protein
MLIKKTLVLPKIYRLESELKFLKLIIFAPNLVLFSQNILIISINRKLAQMATVRKNTVYLLVLVLFNI